MDLREYLSETKVKEKVAFDDIKTASFDLFTSWLYQKHIAQGRGTVFTRNVDTYFETLEYGGWGHHWDDFLNTTDFDYTGGMIEIVLNEVGVEVLSEHTVTFAPLDEETFRKTTDEDIEYLKRVGFITAIDLDSELLEVYTKHFDEIGVEYNYHEDNLYIADYGWGFDYMFKIEKSEKNRKIADIWCGVRAGDYLESDKYFYLVHSEDYEGYNEGFDVVELFHDLYLKGEVVIDRGVIFQMLYEDYVDDTYNNHIKVFFDRLLKEITETSEVIF